MEEDKIIITEVKYFKNVTETEKKDEPDWDKLGVSRPKSDNENLHEEVFEYFWVRKSFPARVVLGVMELDKESTLIELYDREIIIKMSYEQALKEIYNVEIKKSRKTVKK